MEAPLIRRRLTSGTAHFRIRPLGERDLHDWESLEPGCPGWVSGVLEGHVTGLGIDEGDAPSMVDLPIPDRLALLIEVFCASFGEASYVVVKCPQAECRERLDVDFSMRELFDGEKEPEPLPQAEVNGRVFPLRWPTGRDQQEWNAGEPQFLSQVVEACLAEGAPAVDDKDIVGILEHLLGRLPGPRFQLDVRCAHCDCPFQVPVNLAGHFHARMDRVCEEMEHDIHLLASNYHWSEEAILKLPSHRRRRYVSRLEGAWT
jgi:hypothetical protein